MPDASANRRALDREALGAFLIYLILSFVFFGRGIVGDFSTWYVGRGPDPPQMVWSVGWWAYAIAHRVDPFLTEVLFAPVGANLAWTTTVALGAWVAAPLTWTFGPVAAFNVLCLLAPALAGWAAFVLCRWIARSCWPALLGGWVFGFSSYVACSLRTHLNDALIFAVPLALWLALRRLNGDLARRRFVAGMGVLIAAQFLLFPEIAASASFAGGLAFLIALPLVDEKRRRGLRALIPEIAAAYAVAVVLLSPYLYYMFAFAHAGGSVLDPVLFGADLLSFAVPTAINELGRLPAIAGVASTFLASLTETTSYVALPLLAIVVLFARARFREPIGRLLIELLVVICVLALGSRVVIVGHRTIAAPWTLLLQLPLLNKIVPIRLMAYAFLVLAIIVALWFSSPDVRTSHKWALSLTIVPFMLPNLSARFWVQPFDAPPFFSTGLYRQYLSPDEIVMALPNPIYGDGMQWQLTTDMYFRLAGGYIGLSPLAPPEYARWPIMAALYDVAGVPDAPDQLKALLAHERVGAIIVGPQKYWMTKSEDGLPTAATWVRTPPSDRDRAALGDLLATLGVQPLEIGGVTIYQLNPSILAPYLKLGALDLQRRYARARFQTLLGIAERYLAGGGDLDALNDRKYELLDSAPRWFGGPAFPRLNPNRMFQVQWTLGRWHPGLVAVGVEGSYETLRPLIAQYGPDSASVYFPFPQKLDTPAPEKPPDRADAPALMVMEFTPAALASAAARVAPPAVPP
jgi:hypothetical protein